MKGRRPKSTLLRLIEGNPGKREIVPEMIARGDLGPPPNWFRPEQRLKWDHILRSAPAGMLTELDRQLVIQYCVAAAIYDECAHQLGERGGPVVLSPKKGVPMQSPYMWSLNQADAQLNRCLAQLGFSPVSRSRVKDPSARGKAKNRFSDLKKFEI
jgi:P27 family predicted phage terminase small subunit